MTENTPPQFDQVDESGSRPTFSILIPTFNRGHVLTRALGSVAEQTCDDYEILVIDDGSTDGTGSVVNGWRDRYEHDIRYYWQPNQGKHTAVNAGVACAKGGFVVVLDSDDVLVKDALEKFAGAWRTLSNDERLRFAGVEGLCQDSSGAIHGSVFPKDVFDSTYLEVWGLFGITGEKRNCLRRDVMLRYPYPVIAGERHVRPSYTWKQISHEYRMRFINQVVQVVDIGESGLTGTASQRRLRNPKGLYIYWKDDVLHHQVYLPARKRRKNTAQYVRYALHSGFSLIAQYREVPNKALWMSALMQGLSLYLGDCVKAKRYRRWLN